MLKEVQIIKKILLHVTYFKHLAQTWVQKKNEKTMKDFFTSNGRNSVLGGTKQVVLCLKKGSIYLARTNTIEKNNKKKGETTMEIEQKQFHKKL